MEELEKKRIIFAKSILNDYEILINELYKLPHDIRALDDIINALKETYIEIKKFIVYKYKANDINQREKYHNPSCFHFWTCHDTFVQKQLLFNELSSKNYKYNELLDSYFYKVYMKLVLNVVLGENVSIIYLETVDNLEIIEEAIFSQTRTIYDLNNFGRKPIIVKSINILFEDFLKSDLYNRNK